METDNKESLFISYNWNDGGPLAEELENQLSDYFEVERDKTHLKINDDIYEFMASIATCDNVVIVLTKEYVKSINCMLEVSFLLQQPDWSEKVMVLVIDDSIYSPERKIEIINYWDIKKKQLSLTECKLAENIISDEKEKIDSINERLEDFLRGINRINNPSQIAIVNELVRRTKKRNRNMSIVSNGEQVVKDFLKKNGSMTLSEISAYGSYSKAYTHRLVADMLAKNLIVRNGDGKATKYELKDI